MGIGGWPASTNYALTYTPGVLTVNPTEALQRALDSVIGTINGAPSQGNMVRADMVTTGEPVASKADAVAVVRGELEPGSVAGSGSGSAPAVPSDGGNTSVESE